MKCDDPYDRPGIRLRTWTKAKLAGNPLKGWLVMCSLPTAYCYGTDLGIWILAVGTCQFWTERANRRMHAVAHGVGARHLLVHASLRKIAQDTMDDYIGATENCSCGGVECLAGPQQVAAARVLARRAWRQIPMAHRLRIAEDVELDPDLYQILGCDDPFTLRQALTMPAIRGSAPNAIDMFLGRDRSYGWSNPLVDLMIECARYAAGTSDIDFSCIEEEKSIAA